MSGTRVIPEPISGSGSADLSAISGDATSTAGGVLSLANFYKKKTFVDIAGNTNHLYTATELVNGWISRNGVTTTRTELTDTAANIVAAIPNAVIGSWFNFTLFAEYGPGVKITLDGGVGVTVMGGPLSIYGQTQNVFIAVCTNVSAGTQAATIWEISSSPAWGWTTILTTLAGLVSGGNNYFLGSNVGNTGLEFKAPADALSQIGAAASGHDHSGVYQPADADLTTYAGIAPSANAQTLLGQTFAQMQGSLSVDDLITLSGVAEGSVNLSTFTGTTIADNVTIKAALQALETALELKQTADGTLTALAGLTIQDVSIIEGTGADTFNVVVSGGGNRLLGANAGNTALEFKETIAVTSITDTVKIVDADAVTKCIQFDCGNITAGQTRIYSTPDVAGSLVLGPSAGFITFSGPTQARAFALPDEAVSIVTNSATMALNIITSGTLQGLVKVTTKGAGATLTAAEMSGGVVLVTAAVTIELPAVTIGQSVLIYGTAANIVTVHPNASDRIILDGVDKTDHVSIACTAVAGSFIGLFGDSAAGWTTLGKAGTWA